MATDDDFRLRLEGGAELLEIAAVRYRALNLILDSLLWKERLANHCELLKAVAREHDGVARALERAKRLVERSHSKELRRLVEKVSPLVERTEALAAKRAKVDGPLGALLLRLEDQVAPTPEHDPVRWRTARSLLPLTDASVEALGPLTEAVHAFATRPAPERVALPWKKSELPRVLADLSELDGLCAPLWRRLPPKVEVALLEVMRRGEVLTSDGPSALLRAERARRELRERIEAALIPIFAPLKPSPHESSELLRWLAQDDDAPALKPKSRASLFALAALLAKGPPSSAAEWERLMRLASAADDERMEAAALLDNLALFLRIKQQKKGVRRANPTSLSEALRMLRELSS